MRTQLFFLSRRSEALQTCTNINADSPHGRAALAMHFTSQSAPDIRRKLQKLEKGPHTPQTDLLEPAFKVFHNPDQEGRQVHTQALLMVAAAVSQAGPKGKNWDPNPLRSLITKGPL